VKAVIPAAGLGTRFLPIAKAVPKEMMPVGDRPVIDYVVAEAVAAGFDEILIVLSKGKESIRRYFEPDPQLERHLEEKGRTGALEAVRRVSSMGRIQYAFQKEMRGLGDAILVGRGFVGDDGPVAVLLGDTIMRGPSALPHMLEAWCLDGLSSVALEPCPADRVQRYGIAGGRATTRPRVFHLDRLIEKPRPEDAPALLDADGTPLPPHAFAARYLLDPAIFAILESTPPGLNGEVQLTDAMRTLLERRGMLGILAPGRRLDIGTPAGLAAGARELTAAAD
jgi:UTP--glucose-1-phosphate uridylyltransferase